MQLPTTNDAVDLMSISASPSGIYVYAQPYYSNSFIAKHDSSGRQVWKFEASERAFGWSGELSYLAGGTGGVYLSGTTSNTYVGGQVDVKEIAREPSLILLGINPPWSFVTLALLIVGMVAGPIWSLRTYNRRMRNRSKQIREREVSGLPSD